MSASSLPSLRGFFFSFVLHRFRIILACYFYFIIFIQLEWHANEWNIATTLNHCVCRLSVFVCMRHVNAQASLNASSELFMHFFGCRWNVYTIWFTSDYSTVAARLPQWQLRWMLMWPLCVCAPNVYSYAFHTPTRGHEHTATQK